MSSKHKGFPLDNAFSQGKTSFIQKYQDLVIGNRRFGKLVQYELLTLPISQMPGACCLALRTLFYPTLFAKVGKKVVVGVNPRTHQSLIKKMSRRSSMFRADLEIISRSQLAVVSLVALIKVLSIPQVWMSSQPGQYQFS